MAEHDPLRFATGLSAKLATRSRHVCTVFGAGTSKACGLPDIAELQQRILAALPEAQRTALTGQLNGRNLEEGLSRLRRISALLTGDQTIDGLTAAGATELDRAICRAIISEVDISGADRTATRHFAAWLARANYHFPVEIFTVNYDLLFETALEEFQVPYFDGFIGNLRARFQTDLVETAPGSEQDSVPAFFTRLWKLHGSVNWEWDDRQVVRVGQAVREEVAAAIYPSDTKYEESRRVPFLVLQDRMRRALHQPETLVIVAGYSFGDAHLNELLFDAAVRRERTEIAVFCYSDIPELLAERAQLTPNIQVVGDHEAIIGGVRAPWAQPENDIGGIFERGSFRLGDFGRLAQFLAKSASREPEVDTRLRQLLDVIVPNLPINGEA
ncbi:SIR2 family protein [Burkholderia sp. IDO3]|uniref:SIR2 family protein n=1 Tax=Burkholderia sp. IDO3 TaxID=1705310 RepID=UPI000BBB4305|nr:SIR2 family protein [Burkholderia sp. IDO3]AXK66460.1 SIR2 family protein [Burkholderia sp. IDO3]PCD59023.1 SIR2 family protein [Burkholderia sp. IDO3]